MIMFAAFLLFIVGQFVLLVALGARRDHQSPFTSKFWMAGPR